MPGIKKQRLNPLQALNDLQFTDFDHITFDENVVENFRIVRQQTQIGLAFFTDQFVKRALCGLVTSKSRPASMKSLPKGMKPIYTVGEIKLITVMGRVHLYGAITAGQRQRLIIPVKIELVPE